MPPNDPIFEPLRFPRMKDAVKSRVFRSSLSGRFDNYDGSGTHARINWELKFARGGVGGIISSFVPVHVRGRILPNFATFDHDNKIPFWRELGRSVHEYDCRYILQLSHAGRQQDLGGVENQYRIAASSTSKRDYFHGMLSIADGTPRVDAVDFRDELRLRNYPGSKLVYTINVKNFNADRWTRLGTLTFTEDVISEGGDKRIHFWIPSDLPSRN